LVRLHDPENFDFDEIVASGGAVDALVGLKRSGEVGSICHGSVTAMGGLASKP
jgi:D-threo-aldose 1-dehydrogenase